MQETGGESSVTPFLCKGVGKGSWTRTPLSVAGARGLSGVPAFRVGSCQVQSWPRCAPPRPGGPAPGGERLASSAPDLASEFGTGSAFVSARD